VLNLAGHVIVRQFDVPKPKADVALVAAKQALLKLANGTDLEEEAMLNESSVDDDDDGGSIDVDDLDDIDEDEGEWADERDSLTEEELDKLNTTIRPVRLILVKVSLQSLSCVYLTHLSIDPEAFLCGNTLLDSFAAQVDGHAEADGIERKKDALRRDDPLEFNV
jgi:hypothetical protein